VRVAWLGWMMCVSALCKDTCNGGRQAFGVLGGREILERRERDFYKGEV